MVVVGAPRLLSWRRPSMFSAAGKKYLEQRTAVSRRSFPSTFFSRFLVLAAPHSPLCCQRRSALHIIAAAAGNSDHQVDGNENESMVWSISHKLGSWSQLLLDFALKNFLPLALVSGIVLGLLYPSLGCLAHKYSVSKVSTFGIFFISGLMLRSGEIGAAIEAWPAGMLGLGSILLVTPLFSRLILQIKLSPQEFVTGLAIFCCMPTTLSSGVALTQLVRGNSALALAMTVISNLLGILLVPFSLSKFIGAAAGVSIPTMELFKSLISTLLIPLILGKVFRETIARVSEYVDKNRQIFSIFSAVLLSLVPWIQVSRSRSLLLTVHPAVFAAAIGMGTLLHVTLLALNFLAVRSVTEIFGANKSVVAKKENARAVIIVASQKTLPVMVAVVEQLGRAFGEPGLLILPCVASHINQIIIDSFLVNFWLRKDEQASKTKEP